MSFSQDTPEPYEFTLLVADDELGNHQERVESQDENGRVQGQYAWVDAGGVRHVTTYSADPVNGFVVSGGILVFCDSLLIKMNSL